jgi:hypothetical protein
MINHLFIILIGFTLLLSIKCLIVHTQRAKDNEEICVKDHFQSTSRNDLRLCYMNNNRDRSILVWFTVSQSLSDKFHSYRFILRSIEESLFSTLHIQILTNFTELIDLNNHLRIINLNVGQYEICVEFHLNSSLFIYQPRDGCIPIRIGELLHGAFKQSSIQLLIALTAGIVLFFILGLIVQRIKGKRARNDQPKHKSPDQEQRPRTSSILSAVSLRKQRDRIVRKLFRRHIDPPSTSRMRQWARNRAFRHRISTQEQETERPRLNHLPETKISEDSPSLSTSIVTTNDIYVIPTNESSQKISFYLNPSEDYELI